MKSRTVLAGDSQNVLLQLDLMPLLLLISGMKVIGKTRENDKNNLKLTNDSNKELYELEACSLGKDLAKVGSVILV